MIKLTLTALALASGLAFSGNAFAAGETFYLRGDGGNRTQCTGKADAPYSGSGTGQACAWKHISHALGVNRTGGTSVGIGGGDTLVIKAGTHLVGFGTGGDDSACDSTYRSSCVPRPLPSGTVLQPTRIVGEGWNTGCKVKPIISMRDGAYTFIDVNNANNLEIKCLEVTDASNCSRKHFTVGCLEPVQGNPRYLGAHGRNAIYGQFSDNVVLENLNIHGLSNMGVYVSGISDWTIDKVRIHANAYGGWNGQVAEDATDHNSGTIHFKNSEISFNGCTENWPSLQIHACWAAKGDGTGGSSETGYGDGFGLYDTGGHWIFEDTIIHHNTQDGLDLLYVNQPGGQVTLRRFHSWGNAGNQAKVGGENILIENTVLVGQCDYFQNRYMPAMNLEGDICRASGNPLSIRPMKRTTTGTVATIRYSTITGNGDILINVSTGIGEDNNDADNRSIISIENNILYGQSKWQNPAQTAIKSAHLYIHGDLGENGTLPTYQFKNNHIFNVRATSTTSNVVCVGDSYCSVAPGLRNLDLYKFDPRPTSGSNVLGTGTNCGGTCGIPTDDFKKVTRPSPPARGALEYSP